MKIKTLKKIMFTAALLSLSSLTFAEKASNSDEYTDEIPQEQTSIKLDKSKINKSSETTENTDSKDSAKKTKAADNTKKKKTAGQAVKEFIFGKERYIRYETVNLSTGTIDYKLKNREVEMILEPKSKKAGVQTYFQTCWYDILFDEKNRAIVIDSITKYLDDFQSKKLDKKKSYISTRRVYCDNGKCFERWGTTKIMMSSFGDTTFDCGYQFKKVDGKKYPYFIITIQKAKNVNEKAGTNSSHESTEVEIYFTRAQAKAFAELIGRETISQQMNLYYEAEKIDIDEEYDSDREVSDSYDDIE